MREYNLRIALMSFDTEIKSRPWYGPYCFQVHGQSYHLVSPLYSSETNSPSCRRLDIADPVKATTKWLESQSNQGQTMAKVIQLLDEMLR
jgi:hypothetical protein